MTEQDANEKLEGLVGIDRAFRLMRHWEASVQAASGNRYTLDPHRHVDQIENFRRRARRDGFSEAAIDCYARDIQGVTA